MTDTTDQSRRAQKAPLPPDVLADALHDSTHETSGRLLHASPILPATDPREGESEYAELLRDLDSAAAGIQRLDRLDAESAAKAIRALEAKVLWMEGDMRVLRRRDDKHISEIYELRADRDRISANYDVLLTNHVRVMNERNVAWQERDRLAGEVERIRLQFDEAIARIEDMLEDDDGQAFKEAGKFLLRIKGHDHDEV